MAVCDQTVMFPLLVWLTEFSVAAVESREGSDRLHDFDGECSATKGTTTIRTLTLKLCGRVLPEAAISL